MLYVLGVLSIQKFSIKACIKNFGKDGEADVTKELTQNNDTQKYFYLNTKTLNADQRADDLASLMFMVENRYDKIKARSCEYGSKQIRIPGHKK